MFQSDSQKHNPLYIFFHLLKTGGSTFRETIRINWGDQSIIEDYKFGLLNLDAFNSLNKEISAMSEADRNKIKLIIGHSLYYGIHRMFPGREPRYIIFLREPAARAVSWYNYVLSKRNSFKGVINRIILNDGNFISFDEFQKNYSKFNLSMNFAVKMFFENYSAPDLSAKDDKRILVYFKKLLKQCYFVGITEDQESFSLLYKIMGLKKFLPNQNISTKYFLPADLNEIRKNFWPYIRHEEMIYHYARKLNRWHKQKLKMELWLRQISRRLSDKIN